MAGFRSTRQNIYADVESAFMRAMGETVGLADELAPVHDGALHASITWQWIDRTGDALKARFGSALRYAAIRELGGIIRPVRKKLLVWRDYEGKWHAAKEVRQAPGGRIGSPKHGKGYLRPAGEKFGEFMEKQLRRAGISGYFS